VLPLAIFVVQHDHVPTGYLANYRADADAVVGGALQRLNDQPDIFEIVCTNTVPIAPEKRVPKLTVLSVAPALAEAMRRITANHSFAWDTRTGDVRLHTRNITCGFLAAPIANRRRR
jgi:hypothetical protein